ncbi:MAG: hypothetical protein RIT40_2040 [Planctomycetota bacterium]
MIRAARTRSTALVLYAVLLVLPTLVLGGLHWHQLSLDHDSLLAAVPGDARDAGRRLEDALAHNLDELLRHENERAFWEYNAAYFPPGTIGAAIALVPSPLARTEATPGILGWYSHIADLDRLDESLTILCGAREGEAETERLKQDLRTSAIELVGSELRESVVQRLLRTRQTRDISIALPVLAVNMSDEQDVECLRDELAALRGMESRLHDITVSDFHVRFWRERDGTPRIAATRNVKVPRARLSTTTLPTCFRQIGRSTTLRQGFFIDPDWLLAKLPAAAAAQVLVGSQRYVPAGESLPAGVTAAVAIQPLHAMQIECLGQGDQDYGSVRIAVDLRGLQERIHTQTTRFFMVAAMLVLSLATGMWLLLRSVARDLDNARRTENFVAAVTHELRTPVAAIKLHGEMLADGWVEDEAKRAEYYRRILKESGRLELLVERVLEKARLQQDAGKAEPGDLSAQVLALESSLLALGPEGVADLRFEIPQDVPPVMLTNEGVRSIVTNLVENARKYAPVSAGAEPIVVRVAHDKDWATLEVLDRGPGIPVQERERIFEAFYRLGSEQQRRTKGTGLGLHLVALHARAMGGSVQVLAREGGGARFVVRLPLAT